MNSFQKWASNYARAFGFVVTLRGNWVELHKDGETHECMSVAGVQKICDETQCIIHGYRTSIGYDGRPRLLNGNNVNGVPFKTLSEAKRIALSWLQDGVPS